MNKKRAKEKRHRKRAAKPSKAVPPTVSYWVVAFLDLLGYSTILKDFDVFPLPTEGPQRHEVEKAVMRAINLRTRLLGELDVFMKEITSTPPADLVRFSGESQKLAASWRRIKMIQTPGPDHIVLGCSLMQTSDHFPIRAIYTLVTACVAVMLIQLATGGDDPEDTLPLRGGIDLAVGALPAAQNVLYSPALARVYELESKKAIYPRVITGNRFHMYLQSEMNRQDATLEADYARTVSRIIARMFFKDHDGLVALDFFGDTVRSQLDANFAKGIASDAWRFACSAEAGFRAKGDEHLLAKYVWLMNYMRPRLSLWGVMA